MDKRAEMKLQRQHAMLFIVGAAALSLGLLAMLGLL
jgi:hypothetical protein